MPGEYEFKAFLSYSRVDRNLAATLQRSLETFAKTGNAPRRYRIFRDEATLPAGGSLPERLRGAVTASEFLIVIASPDAAHSPWVLQEIQSFLERHPAGRLLIVLARGHLRWDGNANDFVRDAETAFPPIQPFAEEPVYVDLRSWENTSVLEDAVATLTATMSGVPKDELIGAHLEQYERARRRLSFNLAFRGAVGGATAYLGVLFLGESGWALLAGAALGGALAALAAGLRWQGMLSFIPSFTLAGLGLLLSGISPFRNSVIDFTGLFVVEVLLFNIAGAIAGRLTKGLRLSQTVIAFAISGIAASALVVVFASSVRPFPLQLPIFAIPWTVDRIWLALSAVFMPEEIGDARWYLLIFTGTCSVLGGLIGFEHASVDQPRRQSGERTPSRKARLPHILRFAATVVTIGATAVVMSWKPLQKRGIVRDLTAGFHTKFADGGFRDDAEFAAALTTRNALRKSGFQREANELTALIRTSVGKYVNGPNSEVNDKLPAIAKVFAAYADPSEFDLLMRTVEAAAPNSVVMRMRLANAADALGKRFTRAIPAFDGLVASREAIESTVSLGDAALVLDRAGREDDAKQMLQVAIGKIDAYYRTNPIGQSSPLWLNAEVGELLWRYGLWDKLPAWKSTIQVSYVVRAMARAGAWDRALELSELDNYWDAAERALADLVELAAAKGDFDTAFRVYRTLDRRRGSSWTNKASALRRLVVVAAAQGAKGRGAIIRARAEAEAITRGMGDTYDSDVLAELSRMFIAAGDDPRRIQSLHLLEQDTNGVAIEMEVVAAILAQGKRDDVDARLRKAWHVLHARQRYAAQCQPVTQISSQLVALGRLTSARGIVDECAPAAYETDDVQRLNALTEILSAWDGTARVAR